MKIIYSKLINILQTVIIKYLLNTSYQYFTFTTASNNNLIKFKHSGTLCLMFDLQMNKIRHRKYQGDFFQSQKCPKSVVKSFSPSSLEAESGGFVSWRPVWSEN